MQDSSWMKANLRAGAWDRAQVPTSALLCHPGRPWVPPQGSDPSEQNPVSLGCDQVSGDHRVGAGQLAGRAYWGQWGRGSR